MVLMIVIMIEPIKSCRKNNDNYQISSTIYSIHVICFIYSSTRSNILYVLACGS